MCIENTHSEKRTELKSEKILPSHLDVKEDVLIYKFLKSQAKGRVPFR